MWFLYNQKSITVFLFIAVAASLSFCQYREGIDTTNVNGYAHDSLFKIVQNKIIPDMDSNIVMYGFPKPQQAVGYFNYAFDDIQKTPDSIRVRNPSLKMNCCYAIQKGTNLYAKICILQKLADGRYVYRYARNTINQLVPQLSNSLTKPCNVFSCASYVMPISILYLYWERPLTNGAKPKGYILYISKSGTIIDTSKPINMTQWDSVAFTTKDTLKYTPSGPIGGRYFNFVAVYGDGNSDFLNGWAEYPMLTGIVPSAPPQSHRPYSELITLRKTSNGCRIDLSGLSNTSQPESIALYSLTGRQIARIDWVNGNQPLLPILYSQGVSLFKMFFPDNHVASGRCMITGQ